MSKRMVSVLGALMALAQVVEAQAEPAFPALSTVVERAAARSYGVTQARGARAVAEAARVGARVAPGLNPAVQFSVDRGWLGVTKDVSVLGSVALPFEVSGQRGARIEEAEQLAAWRDRGLVDARSVAVGRAVQAYGEVVVGAARIAEAERGESHARQEVALMGERVAAGDATVYELSLADTERTRWSQAKAEARLRLVEALGALEQLLGEEALPPPPENTGAEPPGLRAPVREASPRPIPAVAALQAESSYWEASRKRAEAERNAPVSVLVTAGRGDAGELRLGGGLGFVLPFPRRNQGEIARAQAEQGRAQAEASALERLAKSRLSRASEAYTTAMEAVAMVDTAALPAAERAVDAAFASYRAGKTELTQVLLARRELAATHARRLELLANAWRALGEVTAWRGELP